MISPFEDRIKVSNVRRHKRTADLLLYCGRPEANGSTPSGLIYVGLGNPHYKSSSDAIQRFDDSLVKAGPNHTWWRIIRRIGQRIVEGKTVQLFCWCAPSPCHCDIIRRESIKAADIYWRQNHHLFTIVK